MLLIKNLSHQNSFNHAVLKLITLFSLFSAWGRAMYQDYRNLNLLSFFAAFSLMVIFLISFFLISVNKTESGSLSLNQLYI